MTTSTKVKAWSYWRYWSLKQHPEEEWKFYFKHISHVHSKISIPLQTFWLKKFCGRQNPPGAPPVLQADYIKFLAHIVSSQNSTGHLYILALSKCAHAQTATTNGINDIGRNIKTEFYRRSAFRDVIIESFLFRLSPYQFYSTYYYLSKRKLGTVRSEISLRYNFRQVTRRCLSPSFHHILCEFYK